MKEKIQRKSSSIYYPIKLKTVLRRAPTFVFGLSSSLTVELITIGVTRSGVSEFSTRLGFESTFLIVSSGVNRRLKERFGDLTVASIESLSLWALTLDLRV